MSKRIRVISLFSGIGGSDIGLYAAARELGVEVEVVAAYDSWPKAVAVYNANLPHPVAQVADVKRLTRADLPPHDLIVGGPPCQDHSLAGQKRCKCHIGGRSSARCCLGDFLRLAGDSPYVMENVVPRLINAPFSVKLTAGDFGDVTTRRRWFYSSHLLHVIETPSTRRFGQIRERSDDMRRVGMRSYPKPYTEIADDSMLGSITSHTHDQPLRSGATGDDGMMGSLVASAWHRDTKRDPKGRRGRSTLIVMPLFDLRIGMHQHGTREPNYGDNDFLPTIAAQSWHGVNPDGGVRPPSLLEMARAHSLPDDWNWCNATKTDRGKMIANSWPIGMATAVMRATLVAMGAVDSIAGAA